MFHSEEEFFQFCSRGMCWLLRTTQQHIVKATEAVSTFKVQNPLDFRRQETSYMSFCCILHCPCFG